MQLFLLSIEKRSEKELNRLHQCLYNPFVSPKSYDAEIIYIMMQRTQAISDQIFDAYEAFHIAVKQIRTERNNALDYKIK